MEEYMEKHVIVVSVDALVYEDLENTAGLPVFDIVTFIKYIHMSLMPEKF